MRETLLDSLQKLQSKPTKDGELLEELFLFDELEKKKKVKEIFQVKKIRFCRKKVYLEFGGSFIRVSFKPDLQNSNKFLSKIFLDQVSSDKEIFSRQTKKNYSFSLFFCPQNLQNKVIEALVEWIMDFFLSFEDNILILKNQINIKTKAAILNTTRLFAKSN